MVGRGTMLGRVLASHGRGRDPAEKSASLPWWVGGGGGYLYIPSGWVGWVVPAHPWSILPAPGSTMHADLMVDVTAAHSRRAEVRDERPPGSRREYALGGRLFLSSGWYSC